MFETVLVNSIIHSENLRYNNIFSCIPLKVAVIKCLSSSWVLEGFHKICHTRWGHLHLNHVAFIYNQLSHLECNSILRCLKDIQRNFLVITLTVNFDWNGTRCSTIIWPCHREEYRNTEMLQRGQQFNLLSNQD